jgi:hypothetical protein
MENKLEFLRIQQEIIKEFMRQNQQDYYIQDICKSLISEFEYIIIFKNIQCAIKKITKGQNYIHVDIYTDNDFVFGDRRITIMNNIFDRDQRFKKIICYKDLENNFDVIQSDTDDEIDDIKIKKHLINDKLNPKNNKPLLANLLEDYYIQDFTDDFTDDDLSEQEINYKFKNKYELIIYRKPPRDNLKFIQ